MSEFAIEVEGGSAVRLPTAGKYCDRDILVTATGGDTDAAYSQGVADGTQAEYDRTQDILHDYGNRTDYSNACRDYNPIEFIINSKYPIKPIKAGSMFQSSVYAKELNITLDLSKATTCGTMFAYANYLTTIADLIVNENLDFANPFRACSALTTLGISGTIGKAIDLHWSPLNRASIESVIAILSDTATGMTASFKETAVNSAFETAEGAADGSSSAEWLALVATKENWTISLS